MDEINLIPSVDQLNSIKGGVKGPNQNTGIKEEILKIFFPPMNKICVPDYKN